MFKHDLAAVVLCGALGVGLFGQAPSKVEFRRDVQPIFQQNCISCHGPTQQMNGFRLDQRRYALPNRIGANGARIVPGKSGDSPLYLKLTSNRFGMQMPPAGSLNKEEIQIIQAWIDQGAEWPDDADESPKPAPDRKTVRVLEALRKGDRKTVETILNDDRNIINKRGADGATPLMVAALYSEPALVRLLLERGADPNLKNDAGATALMWAVDDLEKSRLLVEHGADVNAQSGDGRTPLMIAAAQFGAAPVIKLLLDHGANASAKSPAGGVTPLTLAAPFGDESVLRALLERGADVKSAALPVFVSTLRTGCTACLDMLTPLIDRKVFSDALSSPGAPVENIGKIRFLLDRGADVNAANGAGQTALMTAAYSDIVPAETVKLLIDRGAEVNARSRQNETALRFALQRGHTASVDLLLRAGAIEEPATDAALRRPSPANSAREAVLRSLPLLQRTDVSFFQKSGCVSCHNNSLASMMLATARRNGFAVDEKAGRQQLKDTGVYIESWRDRLLQGIAIPGGVDTVSYILLGLAAGDYPATEATDAVARYLKLRQRPDGRWSIGTQRPPIESSDIEVTAVSMRALQTYAPITQRAPYHLAVQRATAWLATAQAKTTEDRAFRLLGLAWGKGKQDAIEKAAHELLGEQRPDGGWSQLPTLESDAYATGQALVALREAGALKAPDPVFKRGVRFLLNSQFEDGSWYVKSRAIKIQPYFDNGFPHGQDQWISAAGTNWAIMALAAAP